MNAAEAAIAFCNTHTHVTTVSAKEDLQQAFKSAIKTATEAAITRITMDEESWGGIKLEWRQDEHRIYAYSANGAFLWSGSPSHAVWSCIRHSSAAHASEEDHPPYFPHRDMEPEKSESKIHNTFALPKRKPAHASDITQIAEEAVEAWCKLVETDGPPLDAWEKATLIEHFQTAIEKAREPLQNEVNRLALIVATESRAAHASEQGEIELLHRLLDTSRDVSGTFPTEAHLQARKAAVEFLSQRPTPAAAGKP